MFYYRNDDGCLATLVALPLIVAWYVLKFALAICVCALVVPVRLIWLLITLPISIFTGEDHTADWDDGCFMGAIWNIFFPSN